MKFHNLEKKFKFIFILKVIYFQKKGIFTQNCFKPYIMFFCYCIKIRMWNFQQDSLKNVRGDRFHTK